MNLAPSGVRKSGTGLDLALAVGVLVAADAIPPAAVERFAFIGEVGLDGSVRPVAGMAPMAAAIGDSDIVVAQAERARSAVVSARMVRPVGRLDVLVAVLKGERPWPEEEPAAVVVEPPSPPDLTDVRGQPFARLALEVAAAGQHHLFLVGPPGAGKTMLAPRLPGLLPPLTPARALEATMVHSAAGVPLPAGGLLRTPPFRAPHHTVSIVAMVGGGTAALRPGELSLAHTGVLFLDELGEFSPAVLDGLRQPLEEHEVRVSRARASRHHAGGRAVGRGDEPVSLRRRPTRPVRVHRVSPGQVPPSAVRAAARPVRSARRRRATRCRRAPGDGGR